MACISLTSCVRATAWIVGTLVLARGIAHGEDARYRVTFGASWSAETHPESFPSNPKFDLNGDAKVDLVDHDYWVHDLKRTSLGDANLDGRFNSTDFVAVFVVGEYEDNVTNNSGWSDGDWTGDGEFTSSDMVAAFLDGAYETEVVAVSTVPEPSVSTWMWLAIPWLAYLRRV